MDLRREPLTVDVPGGMAVSAILHAPPRADRVAVVLGHGAGNDMHHPLLVAVAEGLARRGHRVLRFNFPYKELGRKAPDPMPKLEAAYRAAIAAMRARGDERLVLGGKSMGGRVASHLAAAGEACDGLVFLGYPLHPAGEPRKMRDAHLGAIRAPMLFVEGTRDPLCELARLRPVLRRLRDRASLHVVEGGDHSFDLPKSAGRSRESVYDEIVTAVGQWIPGGPVGLAAADS
jgi:predicted alpha/beta-hydrolase family hydrolase